jgi:hypothetical protein
MPAPQYVTRDYSGGVVEGVAITAVMGSTDTSFYIANTTGWVNAANNPLGTLGPFTVVIDQGTPTAEKILCSAVNLSSGLVTVYTSSGFSGRGYDQTTAQAHVPGGSPAGVQPCWSATEAAEANAAVVFGPGGGGAVVGLTGNPTGRVHAVTMPTLVTSGNLPLFTTVTSDFLKGTPPMTASTHGLTIAVTGYYQINVNSWWTASAATQFQCYLMRSNVSTTVPISSGVLDVASSGYPFNLALTDVISCTAGDIIEPYGTTVTNTATSISVNNTAYNFITASLVSK